MAALGPPKPRHRSTTIQAGFREPYESLTPRLAPVVGPVPIADVASGVAANAADYFVDLSHVLALFDEFNAAVARNFGVEELRSPIVASRLEALRRYLTDVRPQLETLTGPIEVGSVPEAARASWERLMPKPPSGRLASQPDVSAQNLQRMKVREPAL